MKYRAEIDGLRAFAVIPVILFHAGFQLFNGGFVGVDVFFVISGYLITTILIEDLEKKSFSIVNFFERRARRILPALTVMVLVSIVLGWFVLTPFYYRDLFQTSASISFFASNILLYLKSGYFAPLSELKPFLHTWSLAVEEQYYIFFPVFLAITWRFGKGNVFIMIAVMSLASLLLSEWSWRNDERANFYLLHTRVWELFSGSMCAFIVKKRGVHKNNFLAFLGLSAIIFSYFMYNEKTPFPSIYTLVPVLGVVLLIMYAEKETMVAKILSIKVFIGIGLISYSIYLWHQPIFALMRHLSFFQLSKYHYFIAILIVFLISFLSWKFIEKPFRDKSIIGAQQVFTYSFVFISIMFFIGLIGHSKMGFPERLSYETNLIASGSFDKNPRQNECHFLEKLKSIESACIIGNIDNVKPTIAIIGDSHGDMFVHSLSKSLGDKGMAAYNLTFNGCSPVDFEGEKILYTENKCYESVYNFLVEHQEINSVIVSFRWTSMINGISLEEINNRTELLPMKIISKRADIVARKVEELAKLEKHIIIVYPVPEAGEDVPNFTTKKRMFSDKNFTLRIPYKVFKKRNDIVNNALNSITKIERLSRIYPSSVLCNEVSNGFCETVINGFSIYLDDDHLTNYGASLIMPNIVSELTN